MNPDTHDTPKELPASRDQVKARVLSYNFNILPRFSGGYQNERIDTFLTCVDSYDVLLLQEIYSTSVLPYGLQKRFCFKKILLDGLKAKGFNHYVIPRQPSYGTIVSHNVLSDNGLLIASRFPIWHRGSYTFRSSERAPNEMPKGCLFAEVEIPASEMGDDSARVIFFNVHLRPEERTPSESAQVQQMRQFVQTVLDQLQFTAKGADGRVQNCPFVIAGDFNIHGIEGHTKVPTKKYGDLLCELQPLGNLQDVLFENCGFNPPTRPPKLFFPTLSRLERYQSDPQRQDYFLATNTITAVTTRLEKFVVGHRRPYTYLSDHFGISTTLHVQTNLEPMHRSQSTLHVSSMIESTQHEQSDPTSSFRTELLLTAVVVWLAISVSLKLLVPFALLWVVIRYSNFTFSSLPSKDWAVQVSEKAMEGTEEVNYDHIKGYQPLGGVQTVGEMWERSVTRFRTLRCLGMTSDMGETEWLSYGAVDARARELGAGLMQLGVKYGDPIGVEGEACRSAALLELACALYGFAIVPLAGKSATMRTLIDQRNIRTVFADSSSIGTVLMCRSTTLETVVYMHPFADEADQATAKDLNIQLITVYSVEYKGRQNPSVPPRKPEASTVLTYTMDNVSSTAFSTLVPLTHEDVLRDMSILMATNVLPKCYTNDSMLWFARFASLFHRVCVLGLLSHGNAVATTQATHLQQAFRVFQPTLLVTSPSLFSSSRLQLSRAMQRYSILYKWAFEVAFQLRSRLIHLNHKDSSLLRFLFFRSFQAQLGGCVRSIVLAVSQESTPYHMIEHVAVCYAPCVREVCFINSVGLCIVDGVPAPQLRTALKPLGEFTEKAGIGQLVITRRGGEQHVVEVAAKWERAGTLSLLGSPLGVLWPVDYQYAIAGELEAIYSNSRYINDIVLLCQPLKPIVAIVHPNRDTVEFEWQQAREPGQSRQFGWTDLVEYAADLIKRDLEVISLEEKLHHSQVPKFVHLHPHSFRSHSTFLTPFGKVRRDTVMKYFDAVVQRRYDNSVNNPSVLTELEEVQSLTLVESDSPISCHGKLEEIDLKVPVAIDIGGTFAKLAYVMPPNMHTFPPSSAIIHESSSLSDTLGLRTLKYFQDGDAAKLELQQNPHSRVGILHFSKIPSHQIPEFAEYIAGIKAVDNFKPEYTERIRATGGGAFKYASLAKNVVGVKFEVVKEMDAVVKGLNLIIRLSPGSIFTVEPSTGTHLPHRLVNSGDSFSPFPYLLINIGSGISFIKCTSADGDHVRVGGSPIGGATFWGLVRTMTDLTSWEEVIEIMRLDGPGDNKNVDLLVGDIYGYNAKDLPAMLSCESVASSFGKFGTQRFHDAVRGSPTEHFASDDAGEILPPLTDLKKDHLNIARESVGSASSIDIVRSLLHMIAGNVTQLAYLHSKIHGVKNVFFAGGFVRNNPIIWSLISGTMHYWSSGECHAHFLEHDGYLGTIGCATTANSADTDSTS